MNDIEKSLYDSLPDAEELNRRIESLLKVNLITTSYEEIKILVEDKFPFIAFGEAKLNTGKKIFRVRRNIGNQFDEPFNHVRDCGIPKPKDTPFGRANVFEKPVFYGSGNIDLPFLESCQGLHPRLQYEPQNFTLTEWVVQQQLLLVSIVDCNDYHLTRSDIKSASEFGDALWAKNFNSDKVKNSRKLISNFFANQFAKNISNNLEYKFSAYFTEYIRFFFNPLSAIKFDGIVYPSVAYKFQGDNVAIFPESLHKIKAIDAYSVTAYNFDFVTGKFVAGKLRKGKIELTGEISWGKVGII